MYNEKSWSAYTGGWKHPGCHRGNVHLLDIDAGGTTLQLYGGGLAAGADPDKMDLSVLFDGARQYYEENIVPMQWRVQKFLPSVIYLPIADYAAPPWPKAFWHDLVLDLVDTAASSKRPIYKVLFACQGGHGRTGTGLAAFIDQLAFTPPEGKDLVSWLRMKYCDNIIESAAQITYLTDVIGLKIPDTVRPAPLVQNATGKQRVASTTTGQSGTAKTTWVQGPLPKEWE